MPFQYAVKSIKFSDGTKISIPSIGITLLVGANNVGKSQALRELAMRIGAVDVARKHVVTRGIEEKRDGTSEELIAWLSDRYVVKTSEGTGGSESISGLGIASISFGGTGALSQQAAHCWQLGEGLGLLGRAVAIHLSTERRLTAADPVNGYDATHTPPSEPLHALYADETIEERISGSFRKAFGTDLVVDRAGASHIALRCGDRPDAQSLGGQLSMPYARAARDLPLLHDQGDGMRSYAACLLHTDVAKRPIVLIDEPEVFLHPPQARLLAQHLAASTSANGTQAIIATHSSDIVRGALDSGSSELAVIRITRNGATNTARHLDAGTIKKLWHDPLLRASNLLDALFHEHLVLCESDGDCRFYNAVLESLCKDEAHPNVMFAHTGGKDRLPVAVLAMAAVGVPLSVVADLDVLSTEQPLRDIWKGLGGEWDEISDLRKRVATSVTDTPQKVILASLQEQVSALISSASASSTILDEPTSIKIRALLKPTSGWRAIKRGGLSAIPHGDARRNAEELLKILAARGLHVVREGELEGLIPTIGGHGPAWVAEALTLDLAKGLEAKAAREFVASFGLIGRR